MSYHFSQLTSRVDLKEFFPFLKKEKKRKEK